MKDRDLKLDGYNISGNRYRELKYFCRQYREKQSLLRSITEVGSPPLSGGGSGKLSDKTAAENFTRQEENSFIFSRRKKGNKRDVLLCYSNIMEKKEKDRISGPSLCQQ